MANAVGNGALAVPHFEGIPDNRRGGRLCPPVNFKRRNFKWQI